jgi:adenosine deaminase
VKVDDETLLRLPKIDLHCHLEGAVLPETCAALARRSGLPAPTVDDFAAGTQDLGAYLAMYDVVAHLLRTPEDLHRATYEHLVANASLGLRYTELFWSPMVHLDDGLSYAAQLDGITAGARDAETDTGVVTRLIPAIDRERGTGRADQLLDEVIAHRRDQVVGIGLDYDETIGPPAMFERVFARARGAGLGCTAHAGESGPARHVADSIDVLRCGRIDHGYAVLDDPEVVRRCRERRIVFTVCPTAVTLLGVWGVDLTGGIVDMIDAGLLVTIGTDAPPQYGTDLVLEHRAVLDAGVPVQRLAQTVLDGMSAAFLDDVERAEWSRRLGAQIDAVLAPSGSVTDA